MHSSTTLHTVYIYTYIIWQYTFILPKKICTCLFQRLFIMSHLCRSGILLALSVLSFRKLARCCSSSLDFITSTSLSSSTGRRTPRGACGSDEIWCPFDRLWQNVERQMGKNLRRTGSWTVSIDQSCEFKGPSMLRFGTWSRTCYLIHPSCGTLFWLVEAKPPLSAGSLALVAFGFQLSIWQSLP